MSRPGNAAVQSISGVLCLRDAFWPWVAGPIVHFHTVSKPRSHRLVPPPVGGVDPFSGCRHRGWWQHQGPDRKISVSFISNEPRRSQSQLAMKQMNTGLPAMPANPRAAGLSPGQPGKTRRSAQPSRQSKGMNPQTVPPAAVRRDATVRPRQFQSATQGSTSRSPLKPRSDGIARLRTGESRGLEHRQAGQRLCNPLQKRS
jgi:hypothetical protein